VPTVGKGERVHAKSGADPGLVRVAKDAHTDLEPEPSVPAPHSWLSRSTSTNPRPPMSMTCGVVLTGTEAEPSRMVSSTTPFISDRVTTNGVRACTVAFVASSLATSRISSTRYRRPCATRCSQMKSRAFDALAGSAARTVSWDQPGI
jgi:hypothetical protein